MEQSYSESFMADLKDKYSKVKKLLDEETANDPETDPHRSRYAAMVILKEMENLLVHCATDTEEHQNKISSMLAVVYLNEGIVAIDTEELKSGENYLNKCIDTLNKNHVKNDTILAMISALNQLGILWSKRDDAKKGKEYLDKAEKTYKDYKNSGPDSIPKSMSSLLGIADPSEPPASEVLERLHTLTLYYLAQIYGSIDELLKSAVYCHMTLSRQLEENNYDSIDWALNVATLSQFFTERNGFKQARHHLAAATYILGKYEDSLKLKSSKELVDAESEIISLNWETYKRRSADVSRCWAKYGIVLMNASKERLVASNESSETVPPPDCTNIQTDPQSDISQETLDNLKFKCIEKDIEHIANNVTDKYLLDFNDAKEVFLNVQKWLEDAKVYYTLEDQASDYVQIIQDLSLAYKSLSFFEENEDRQAKMHKRRIDLLEGVIKQLNEKYYASVCQQIWIELGETYSEILDIKMDRVQSNDDRPTPHVLSKINNLTNSAISNFQKFVNSVSPSKKNGKFPEELIRPVLCTYFQLGRLYNKFVVPDKQVQLVNTKKSLEAYKFVVEYCKDDKKASEIMVTELNLCKDFTNLLPIKITKLTQELSTS